MKFLKNNWAVLSFVFFVILGETGHLPFADVHFRDDLNLDSPVYFLINQFAMLNFWPALIIFLYIDGRNKESKAIAFGLIMWNVKELVDEVAYLGGVNTNVFEINGSFWGQLIFIVTLVSLSAFGYYRWKR